MACRDAWLVCFVAAAVSVQSQSSQAIAPAVTQFDPQPWIDDFHELTSAMASHYADLDWAIRDRRDEFAKASPRYGGEA